MSLILGSTYPVSALVPSIMPAPAAGSDSKQPAHKPNELSAAEPSRVLSNRVTAFLTTDQTATSKGSRPDSQGTRGPAPQEPKVGREAETALLLDKAVNDESDIPAHQSGNLAGSIVLDEAKIYRPSSLY
ncbi:hypothetical protein [Hoeflea sp. EC-HK425]|jgi:hypothetical protein|uniref:hypothetical protein n=1 Tax=Hoeflea sp. EC-HK425 TaxID=2038388 RepID=UPI0012519C13|nr:hypothetical protein [Hoeflea sp. EC-HK425]VVT12367.1 conserved hypothetical protein [Hoeflea sp. EC-HK425]|tara:strand:+ start:222 stop:611 length:390 start_codon:yes stop_codon:yes gene_type:complete